MVKKIHISKSKIHGNGIFATADIRKGEIVFILKGKPKKLIIRSKKDSDLGPDWIGVGKSSWIDPDEPFKHLNHSCDPNMGIKGRITFVALKHIKRGEELTFDYSITEDDIHWSLKCKCGSKKCRKNIRSIQFLPKKALHKYLPFVPLYFLNVYNKVNR